MDLNQFPKTAPRSKINPQSVGVIALLLVVLIAGGWWYKSNQNKLDLTLVASAPEGELVSSVPKEFILANDAVVVSSQDQEVTMPGTTGYFTLSTATYKSMANSNDLFVAYQDFLKNRGYTIAESNAGVGVANIRAINTESTVSVGIRSLPDAGDKYITEVTISFSSLLQ